MTVTLPETFNFLGIYLLSCYTVTPTLLPCHDRSEAQGNVSVLKVTKQKKQNSWKEARSSQGAHMHRLTVLSLGQACTLPSDTDVL